MGAFIKKQSIGFYVVALSILMELLGLVFYLVNSNTAYYKKSSTISFGFIALAVIFIVISVIYILSSNGIGLKKYFEWLPVVNGIVCMLAFMNFLSLRVYSFTTIITFEKSEQNMSDMKLAIIGIVFCLAAVFLHMIGSFLSVRRKESITLSVENERES